MTIFPFALREVDTLARSILENFHQIDSFANIVAHIDREPRRYAGAPQRIGLQSQRPTFVWGLGLDFVEGTSNDQRNVYLTLVRDAFGVLGNSAVRKIEMISPGDSAGWEFIFVDYSVLQTNIELLQTLAGRLSNNSLQA